MAVNMYDFKFFYGACDLLAHRIRRIQGRVRILKYHLHFLYQIRLPLRNRLGHMDAEKFHFPVCYLLQGDLSIESRPGKGTAIKLAAPLKSKDEG